MVRLVMPLSTRKRLVEASNSSRRMTFLEDAAYGSIASDIILSGNPTRTVMDLNTFALFQFIISAFG